MSAVPVPRPARCTTLLIGALGGEGGGVLTDWIVAAARAADLPVQATSIPGVAQRTGATTYYVELYPVPRHALDGLVPVMCLSPTPGDVDVFLCSELMEAARALAAGWITADTTVIASTHRVYATIEKMAQGDGRFDSARGQDALRRVARRALLVDLQAECARTGAAMSAVMLGALLGSAALPLRLEDAQAAVRASGRSVDASLRGLAAGFECTSVPAADGRAGVAATRGEDAAASAGPRGREPLTARRAAELGEARCRDYQDAAYAALYRERLARVCSRWPGDDAIARETARHLALLMCYEDVARVADLKSRPERIDRIRAEARAAAGEPVHVIEFFKPGWDEVADLLPARPAAWLRRRAARRGEPAVFRDGLQLRTTTATGWLRLRLMASLRAVRRRSSRFAAEQALIERWLAAVLQADDAGVAHEVARLARLVKGYADTHRRGRDNFVRILQTLVEPRAVAADALAAAIRDAHAQALSDPDSLRLDTALARHGIAPRPPRESVIRFVPRTATPTRRPG